MTATTNPTADFEEYPELSSLVNAVIRPLITIMEAHDIKTLRRIRKTGVFEHPYAKDIVIPLGVSGVPDTVSAARYAVGRALLDYLEAVGLHGLTINAQSDEIAEVSGLWAPRAQDSKQLSPATEPRGEDQVQDIPGEQQSPADSHSQQACVLADANTSGSCDPTHKQKDDHEQ